MKVPPRSERGVFIRWCIIGAYTSAWAVMVAAVGNIAMNQWNCNSNPLSGSLFICSRYRAAGNISAPTSEHTSWSSDRLILNRAGHSQSKDNFIVNSTVALVSLPGEQLQFLVYTVGRIAGTGNSFNCCWVTRRVIEKNAVRVPSNIVFCDFFKNCCHWSIFRFGLLVALTCISAHLSVIIYNYFLAGTQMAELTEPPGIFSRFPF